MNFLIKHITHPFTLHNYELHYDALSKILSVCRICCVVLHIWHLPVRQNRVQRVASRECICCSHADPANLVLIRVSNAIRPKSLGEHLSPSRNSDALYQQRQKPSELGSSAQIVCLLFDAYFK